MSQQFQDPIEKLEIEAKPLSLTHIYTIDHMHGSEQVIKSKVAELCYLFGP
jgi:hypothetical protein